jgi:alkylation response protein AidB-like acyl-CoA dehydrogenase
VKPGTPGPAGSTAKLQWAELNKRIGEFCVDLMGAEGMLYPDGYELSIPDQDSGALHSHQRRFLRARANSIEGGTSEIMRNILGERVLGLPGEPRLDRDLPWSQIPR